MKLAFINSQNFLSLNGEIVFGKKEYPEKITLIVGPNNAGKTNIARSLKFAKLSCERSFKKDQAEAFIDKYSNNNKFKLEIGFCLDKEEKDDFNLFLEIYANFIFRTENEKIRTENEKIKSYLSKEMIQDLLQSVFGKMTSSSIVVHYNNIKNSFPLVNIEFNVNVDKDEYKLRLDERNNIYQINIPMPSSSSNLTKRDLTGWLKEYLNEKNPKSITIKELLRFILKNGGLSLSHIQQIHYEVNDKDRGKFLDILEKYNCPYGPGIIINPYLFLSHMFASCIILLDEIRARPVKQIEDKQFKTKIKDSSFNFYNSTGESLAFFLYKLKNSKKMTERKAYQEIRTLFKEFTDLEFDISHTLVKEKKNTVTLHEFEIWIMDEKTQISIDYGGGGLLEALNIFSILVGNRNCVIVLDEPALHLHPIKQRQLIKLIKEAIEKSNNQFIIITHSPYLIETDSLDNVIRFNLENNKTKIYPFVNILNQENKNKIKKAFALNPHYKNILFARRVIIVEGESEEIAVPFLLQKRGLHLEEHDIELFNAHADTHFKISAKIAESLNLPYVIVCDSNALPTIEEHKDKVFAFEGDDFVDFLQKEFSNTCREINKSNLRIRSKPQKTMMILEKLPDEAIKSSKKVEEFFNFVKEKLGIEEEEKSSKG